MDAHLLSGDYLFSIPSGWPSGYFAALTACLVALFLLSAFAYFRAKVLTRNNAVMRRFLKRMAEAGMWLAGTGVFLALMRYVQLDYLDAPILMLLVLIAMILTAGYFVYDYTENYPVLLQHVQAREAARAYRREPKRKGAAKPVRPNVPRGKRRR